MHTRVIAGHRSRSPLIIGALLVMACAGIVFSGLVPWMPRWLSVFAIVPFVLSINMMVSHVFPVFHPALLLLAPVLAYGRAILHRVRTRLGLQEDGQVTQHHHMEESAVGGHGPARHWQNPGVVGQFVEQTTSHDAERRVFFDFGCDLFPFTANARIRVLDLGAGYGSFSEAILDRFPNANAVALDVSEPMMAAGRERMRSYGNRFVYHPGDVSDGVLPADLQGSFDAVVTSAFMPHFEDNVKERLCSEIYRVLSPGGCFVNVDLVAPANEEIRDWYRAWRDRQDDEGLAEHGMGMMLHHYFDAMSAHHLDTEAVQLSRLKRAGFVSVDCFYKHLLQVVIAGFKPA